MYLRTGWILAAEIRARQAMVRPQPWRAPCYRGLASRHIEAREEDAAGAVAAPVVAEHVRGAVRKTSTRGVPCGPRSGRP